LSCLEEMLDSPLFLMVLLIVVSGLVSVTMLAMVVLFLAHVVRVCVAKARAGDMTTIVPQLTDLISSLEPFTPRHQGIRNPLRGLRTGLPAISAPVVDPSSAAAEQAAPAESNGSAL
jgi:hypothetical protein